MNLEFTPQDMYVASMYLSGPTTIFIGTDLDRLIEDMREHSPSRRLKQYNFDLEKIATETTEHSITHETIHIVLYSLIGIHASYNFDNVDENHEISEYHVKNQSCT